jgi:fructose-1,6-bisphosphatase
MVEHVYFEGEGSAIVKAIMDSVHDIAQFLRYKCADELKSQDPFKKNQKLLDLKADDIIFDHLKKAGNVRFALSEDYPDYVALNPEGKFTVTFDPIDGDDVLDSNFSIGSSFGIWETHELNGLTGRKLLCAMVAIYGSRTSLLVYNVRTKKVEELSLMKIVDTEKWFVTQKDLKIAPKAKLFSGALRSTYECPALMQIFNDRAIKGHSIRYSGCTLLDMFQIFIKQQGVYLRVNTISHPARFSVLYEGIPFAFLFEKAGGICLTQEGENLLDITISAEPSKQKVSCVCGSKDDVAECVELLKGGQAS